MRQAGSGSQWLGSRRWPKHHDQVAHVARFSGVWHPASTMTGMSYPSTANDLSHDSNYSRNSRSLLPDPQIGVHYATPHRRQLRACKTSPDADQGSHRLRCSDIHITTRSTRDRPGRTCTENGCSNFVTGASEPLALVASHLVQDCADRYSPVYRGVSRSTRGESVPVRSCSQPLRGASFTMHPLSFPRRNTSRLTTRCTTTSPR